MLTEHSVSRLLTMQYLVISYVGYAGVEVSAANASAIG